MDQNRLTTGTAISAQYAGILDVKDVEARIDLLSTRSIKIIDYIEMRNRNYPSRSCMFGTLRAALSSMLMAGSAHKEFVDVISAQYTKFHPEGNFLQSNHTIDMSERAIDAIGALGNINVSVDTGIGSFFEGFREKFMDFFDFLNPMTGTPYSLSTALANGGKFILTVFVVVFTGEFFAKTQDYYDPARKMARMVWTILQSLYYAKVLNGVCGLAYESAARDFMGQFYNAVYGELHHPDRVVPMTDYLFHDGKSKMNQFYTEAGDVTNSLPRCVGALIYVIVMGRNKLSTMSLDDFLSSMPAVKRVTESTEWVVGQLFSYFTDILSWLATKCDIPALQDYLHGDAMLANFHKKVISMHHEEKRSGGNALMFDDIVEVDRMLRELKLKYDHQKECISINNSLREAKTIIDSWLAIIRRAKNNTTEEAVQAIIAGSPGIGKSFLINTAIKTFAVALSSDPVAAAKNPEQHINTLPTAAKYPGAGLNPTSSILRLDEITVAKPTELSETDKYLFGIMSGAPASIDGPNVNEKGIELATEIIVGGTNLCGGSFARYLELYENPGAAKRRFKFSYATVKREFATEQSKLDVDNHGGDGSYYKLDTDKLAAATLADRKNRFIHLEIYQPSDMVHPWETRGEPMTAYEWINSKILEVRARRARAMARKEADDLTVTDFFHEFDLLPPNIVEALDNSEQVKNAKDIADIGDPNTFFHDDFNRRLNELKSAAKDSLDRLHYIVKDLATQFSGFMYGHAKEIIGVVAAAGGFYLIYKQFYQEYLVPQSKPTLGKMKMKAKAGVPLKPVVPPPEPVPSDIVIESAVSTDYVRSIGGSMAEVFVCSDGCNLRLGNVLAIGSRKFLTANHILRAVIACLERGGTAFLQCAASTDGRNSTFPISMTDLYIGDEPKWLSGTLDDVNADIAAFTIESSKMFVSKASKFVPKRFLCPVRTLDTSVVGLQKELYITAARGDYITTPVEYALDSSLDHIYSCNHSLLTRTPLGKGACGSAYTAAFNSGINGQTVHVVGIHTGGNDTSGVCTIVTLEDVEALAKKLDATSLVTECGTVTLLPLVDRLVNGVSISNLTVSDNPNAIGVIEGLVSAPQTALMFSSPLCSLASDMAFETYGYRPRFVVRECGIDTCYKEISKKSVNHPHMNMIRLDYAVSHIRSQISHEIWKEQGYVRPLEPYDLVRMLTGCYADSSPINRSASVGAFSVGGGKLYTDNHCKLQSVGSYVGRGGQDPHDAPGWSYFKQRYDMLLNQLSSGIIDLNNPDVYYTTFGKTEAAEVKEAGVVKQARLIMVATPPMQMLIRVFVGPIADTISRLGIGFTKMDAYSGTDSFLTNALGMLSINPEEARAIDLDFGKWDTTAPGIVFKKIIRMMLSFMDFSSFSNPELFTSTLVDLITEVVVIACVSRDKWIINHLHMGQSSGNPLTSVSNSLVNMALQIYALSCFDPSTQSWCGHLSYHIFDYYDVRIIKIMTHGDDMAMVFCENNPILKGLCYTELARIMTSIGMKPTPADKGSTIIETKSFVGSARGVSFSPSDCQFLKRVIVKSADHDCGYALPIDIMSIVKQMTLVQKGFLTLPRDEQILRYEQLIIELSLHGRRFFYRWAPRIIRTLDECGFVLSNLREFDDALRRQKLYVLSD